MKFSPKSVSTVFAVCFVLSLSINKKEMKGVISMTFKYLCDQIVRILNCDICWICKDGTLKEGPQDGAGFMNPAYWDAEFRNMILNRERKEYPDIIHEKECIFYAALGMGDEKLLIGPVCIVRPTSELNNYIVQKHHLDKNIGFKLTYCDMKKFGSGVLLVYDFLTEREMSLEELWEKNEVKEIDLMNVSASVTDVIFQRQESGIPHNPYDQEKRELDSIRHGNTELLRQSLAETYRGEVGKLSRNQLRQAKNIAICVITLASRAAIEGGMLPEPAFSMVDGYILRIEEMTNSAKIDAMMRRAEFDFAEEVAKLHKKENKNELIEKTKNYIFQKLHDEIVIGDIAHSIGVNASYLSNLFRKVEGITIQKYILREKIRLAENMLRYSDYDAKEIAAYLSFCSQSYFGRVFKEQTSMSPVQYRKIFGKFNKNK